MGDLSVLPWKEKERSLEDVSHLHMNTCDSLQLVSNAEINLVKTTFKARPAEPMEVVLNSTGDSPFSANVTIIGASVEFIGGSSRTGCPILCHYFSH